MNGYRNSGREPIKSLGYVFGEANDIPTVITNHQSQVQNENTHVKMILRKKKKEKPFEPKRKC